MNAAGGSSMLIAESRCDDDDDEVPMPRAPHLALIVREAILFITAFDPPAKDLDAQLTGALRRLAVSARLQRVVALAEHPQLGSKHQVRVTPCLMLDLGTRQVQLVGELAQLDAQRLEAALLQR